MDTRERVARELERWQKQIEINAPRNGPHAEASAILRVVDEERAKLVKALEYAANGFDLIATAPSRGFGEAYMGGCAVSNRDHARAALGERR